MTPRLSVITLVLSAALASFVVALTAARTSAAAVSARAAEATFEQAQTHAERVLALRGRSQTVALGAQPQGDAFQRVSETLAASGLASTRVESVTPSGDRALSGHDAAAARRVQSFRVVLSPILLNELGAFLDRWRREHRLWTVTGVDLTPVSNRGEKGAFRATLTAAAVYVDGSASARKAKKEQSP